jgi:hypothetical protein
MLRLARLRIGRQRLSTQPPEDALVTDAGLLGRSSRGGAGTSPCIPTRSLASPTSKRGKSRGCQAVAHRCLTIAGKYGTSG